MQVAPSNPVLQALAGAQEVGNNRPTTASVRTETVRAVRETKPDEESSNTRLKKDEPLANGKRPPRGSVVDMKV